jgi:hypothetical protein
MRPPDAGQTLASGRKSPNSVLRISYLPMVPLVTVENSTIPAASTESGSRRFWPFALLYAALALTLLSPLTFHMGERLPDDSDALQNLWIVWWGATHFQLGYPGIYQANGYYPNPLPLVYSEPQFSQALLSWPLFNGLDNHVLAYNLLVVLSLCLSGIGAHLFLRELVKSSGAAFVGAVVYAFSAYSFSQLARPQLMSLQWIPLALWCLHRYFSRKSVSSLAGLVLFSVLLGLACFYYLQFYLVALAILVPGYLIAYRSWQRPKDLVRLGAAFGLVAIPLGLAAVPYFEIFHRYGFTGHSDSTDLFQMFKPPAGSLFYGWLDPLPSEPDLFLGFLTLGLAGLGVLHLVRARRREDRVVALTFLTLGLLTFFFAAGPDLIWNGERIGIGPYRLLQLVGPFRNLRDPHRFSVLTRLALALFAAAGAARIAAGGPRRRVLVPAILAALLLGEQWSPRRTRGTEIPVGPEIPDAYRVLADGTDRGPVAELPVVPFGKIRRNTLESYFSTYHGRPILVGKPSFPPPSFELLRWELRGFPDHKSIVLLGSLGVTEVLVHPKRWGPLRDPHMNALGRRAQELPIEERFPDRDDPLWNHYQLGGEELHRVAPLGESEAPRDCDCREIDRGALRVDANGANDPRLAMDGDRSTRWTTGGMQQEGFFFEIAFDRPRVPVRVEIEMTFPYDEFARNLEVNGFRGQRFWRLRRIEDVGYTAELVHRLVDDPVGARLRYDLEPMEVDRMRLFIHETEDGVPGWSIPEIHVYEAVHPPPQPNAP